MDDEVMEVKNAHLDAKHIKGKPFSCYEELSIIISSSTANAISVRTTTMAKRNTILEGEDIGESVRKALVGEDTSMDVEEGDILETPIHSRAGKKGKSITLTTSQQTKRKKRAMADTLAMIAEVVSGLGLAIKKFKTLLTLTSIGSTMSFSILMALQMMSLQEHEGISLDVNMSNIFFKINDVKKL
ncbi:hypothetical protein AMTR_s00027p00220340 [Amborella trichopoda]|uniref:Uncharacterized protein n=1 Tax=Amborella trichopoda TaxID=13333 RepID=W1PSG8_AMBTC|nr:hypothetical protein AMTR_s00027p00220340 [Amborella trichopoda]